MVHRMAPALSLLAVAGFLAWLGLSGGQAPSGSGTSGDDPPVVATPRCAVPVAWRLADVDPRFGVSREWVAGAARDAARAWGSLDGVSLLAEDDEGGLGIRLVYDERQALLGTSPPRRFEAAVYREVVSDGGGGPDRRFREIRVFAFRDRVDLVRILAHELGHALGLPHTPGDGDVMSAEQDGADPSSRPVHLQSADRRALEALCATSVPGPVMR